jgi:hypothetical protein
MTKSGPERANAARLAVKYQLIFTAIAEKPAYVRAARVKNDPGSFIPRNRSGKQFIQRMLNLAGKKGIQFAMGVPQ